MSLRACISRMTSDKKLLRELEQLTKTVAVSVRRAADIVVELERRGHDMSNLPVVEIAGEKFDLVNGVHNR